MIPFLCNWLFNFALSNITWVDTSYWINKAGGVGIYKVEQWKPVFHEDVWTWRGEK